MITEIKKRIRRVVNGFIQVKKKPKDIVGVDIAEDRIAVVLLRVSPEPAVKDFLIQKRSANDTDDALSKAITDIFTRKSLFKKEVWLNMDLLSQGISFGRVSLPPMPQSEMPDAIKWNLKDKVSFDIKASEVAYEVVGESQQENGPKNLDIAAVLTEKSLINRFLGIFKTAGITLAGINTTPFSIANVIRTDKSLAAKTGPVLVCHHGIEYTRLCIYVKGKLDFVREIPLGFSSFLNSMTGKLVSDKGTVELTLDDAKKILEEQGIPEEAESVLGGRVNAAQVIALVRPVIERLKEEISRSVTYYQQEFNPNKMEKILLTGEGANIKGFSGFISEYLGREVEYLELPQGLSCGAAIGAALGYNGPINLLPSEIKAEKKEEMKTAAIRLVAVAVFGTLLVSFLTVSEQIKNYRKELEVIKKQRAILADVKSMRDKIAARQAVISGATEKNVPIDLVFKELSDVTPANIAFSRLWLNQSQRALKIIGRVSTKPQASVQDALSDFMTRLEKTSFIREASLLNAQKEASGPGETSVFEIDCVLKN